MWVILERCVHLATLVLLILMISIVFNNNKTGDERNNFNLQLEEFRQDVIKVRAKNINFLEGRINKVAETQDNYQVSTSGKLSILEKRMDVLLQNSKINTRIINNNNSNAVVNIPAELATKE